MELELSCAGIGTRGMVRLLSVLEAQAAPALEVTWPRKSLGLGLHSLVHKRRYMHMCIWRHAGPSKAVYFEGTAPRNVLCVQTCVCCRQLAWHCMETAAMSWRAMQRVPALHEGLMEGHGTCRC